MLKYYNGIKLYTTITYRIHSSVHGDVYILPFILINAMPALVEVSGLCARVFLTSKIMETRDNHVVLVLSFRTNTL